MTEKADDELKDVLKAAKVLAVRYYRITGKPLGVTGEVAEYEAAQKTWPATRASPNGLL
jgi:hypothetical protein